MDYNIIILLATNITTLILLYMSQRDVAFWKDAHKQTRERYEEMYQLNQRIIADTRRIIKGN